MSLETKEVGPIPCPAFGKALAMTKVQKNIHGESREFICIKPTMRTELYRVFKTMCGSFAAAFLLLILFYLPDYVFDYSQRGEGFIRFFFRYILVMVVILSFASTLYVFLKNRTLYIDQQCRRIIFARFLTDKTWDEEGVDFNEINSIETVPTNSMFGTTKVVLLAHGEYYIAADAKSPKGDLEALANWLKGLTGGENS